MAGSEAEKFCLKWNDFETNLSRAFSELREEKDFFDVTLVCEDNQLDAHKVILSACSPFFRNILKKNPHKHPLLYLKDVRREDMQSILTFMYQVNSVLEMTSDREPLSPGPLSGLYSEGLVSLCIC